MTRIVPEQIVETIDRLFIGESKGAGTAALTDERVYHLRAIVLLVHQLPSELLVIDAKDFADLTVATAAIDLFISKRDIGRSLAIPHVSGEDVVHTVRRVLAKCRDEATPTGTADLLFIADQKVRDSMRLDIGAVNTALQNAEWKRPQCLGVPRSRRCSIGNLVHREQHNLPGITQQRALCPWPIAVGVAA